MDNATALKSGAPRLRANAAVRERHFAEGCNFSKMFWIVLIGSVLGYIVETLYCFYQNGRFESRANLVYGPFNLVYGAGALALYLGLRKISKKNHIMVFLIGAVSGTAVEFVCSWAQEMAFGTVSWDYTNAPGNIGGRVCLKYAVFWGVLAILWVNLLLPGMEKLISKIPNSVGRVLTWCLFAFLLIDAVVSIAAVARWMTRLEGIPAVDSWNVYLDREFPDDRMQQIYANMKFN